VENGVDYHGLKEIPAADEDWDITYVGRLAEHKNVNWLLDAVATVSDELGCEVETCIVGDGPEREALEDRAEAVSISDHVHFQGFVEADEDVIGHLKTADVFVLPSIREGFPNTILEANACSVPSIVVDVLTDDNLQADLSEGARAYGEAHGWDEIVADLEAVYLHYR
jgi:glycosyltransferase involved in cell wall biosynthesis